MNRFFQQPSWRLSILSGLIMGIATYPFSLGFFAWFGFVPLIHVLLHSSPKNGARNAFLFALTFHLVSVYWIGNNSGASFGVVLLSLIAAVIYLSLFWGVFGYLFCLYRDKSGLGLLSLPFFIVSLEWLRSFGPLGFPWLNLALTQSHYLSLIQMIEITGSYGVTFWLTAVNGIFYILLTQKQGVKQLSLAMAVFFLSLILAGSARMRQFDAESKSVKVAVIQPNIDPNEKWDRASQGKTISIMDSLHLVAIDLQPDLVLWPEAALPVYLRLNSQHRKRIQAIVDQSKIPLLTGTVDRKKVDGERHYFNASMYFTPNNAQSFYNKIHLVPFAEYIPMSEYFPSLRKLNFGQGNFTHGSDFTLFQLDSTFFSNIICYESSMPNMVRKFVKSGAEFLSIEANDGYLGNTAGPYQHFELARLRAIENRVSVIRAANTGISGLISASGQVKEKISLGTQKVFLAHVSYGNSGSFYTRYGDVFAIFCLGLLMIMGIRTWKN
ncbi:MAG: apolipoprotein N-acyltransferase [Candidatus Marinimicrobia bacterium]|jgi:apolipoprotein N-acyltransferase|nr:apolipoprotein N-acyltransferase [Candidatus Neomarinimicrobiota bacterium]